MRGNVLSFRNRCICRFTALLLFISLCALFPYDAVNAASLTEEQFASKLGELQGIYREGEYWNGYNDCGFDGTGPLMCASEECIEAGYCGGDGGCDCTCGAYTEGGREIAWQCMGFAYKTAYLVFGASVYSDFWTKTEDKETEVFAGDIARINDDSHSIFITRVTPDVVYYADCNRTGPCRVSWEGSYSMEEFREKLSYIDHFTGNELMGTGNVVPDYGYELIPEGVYYLKNAATGTYLTLPGGEQENGTDMVMDVWSDDGHTQAVGISTVDGFVTFRMVPACGTSLVNAWGNNPGHESRVTIYRDCNHSTQWWKFEKAGDGYVIRNAYNPMCVLDTGGSNSVIAEYHGGDSQIWLLQSYDEAVGEFRESHPHEMYKTVYRSSCRTEGSVYEMCDGCGKVNVEPLPEEIHVYSGGYCFGCGMAEVKGDADGNGAVSLGDVSVVLKHSAGCSADFNEGTADTDGNGCVNFFDATMLIKYIAGWDITLK